MISDHWSAAHTGILHAQHMPHFHEGNHILPADPQRTFSSASAAAAAAASRRFKSSAAAAASATASLGSTHGLARWMRFTRWRSRRSWGWPRLRVRLIAAHGAELVG